MSIKEHDVKEWVSVAYVTAVALVLVCSGAFALPVGIPNPGAEEARRDDAGRPAHVDVYTSAKVDASFSRDTSVKRSGEASFHVVNRGRSEVPKGGASQSALFIIVGDAVPGLTYSITGFIKTKDVIEGDAGLHIRLKSARGWLASPVKNGVVKGTNDWTQINASFTAPIGATQFKLFLSVRHKGEAWFDDIEISDDLETWAPATFSALHEKLARLESDARSAAPEEDIDRLATGVAKAEELLKQTGKIPAGHDLPIEGRRRYVEEAAELDMLILQYARSVSVLRAVARARAARGGGAAFVAGFAPSTVHVFLEDLPVEIEIAEQQRMLAVRGETESTQLVILATEDDLLGVRVAVSELAGDADVIPAQAVVVKPVGFVRTEIVDGSDPYPREHDYVGWWPDQLLENFPLQVKRGDSQPVWIEVRVPRGIEAGRYRGRITVTPSNAPACTLGLEVDVADVDLPKEWVFRNLLCFDDGFTGWPYKLYGDRWTEELRSKFVDFLLERRINLGGLSGSSQRRITVEDMIEYAKRGQNVIFTYQFHVKKRMQDANGNPVGRLPAKLADWLPKLKEAGFYDRAVVYGWDERGPEWYPDIRIAADLLAREYPGVPLLMAGVDTSCGTDSILGGLPNIIFCPLMGDWDADAVRAAKARGNEIWWYDVWWNIEQPLIRSRLIPWQSFKVGADGFLIWSMNRWTGENTAVTPKIRSDWNPALDGAYVNSTAMYVYPGEDGPISSLRLENFRDGMEDYALLALARDLLADLEEGEGSDAALIENLRKATTLEDDFVKDHADYSRDPSALAGRRRTLIRAIEEALAADQGHIRSGR